MSKTQLSSAVKVGRKTFTTNAKPDPYDFRDLEYRPVLQTLDPSVHANRQDAAFTVLTQEGQSCTGHAVAATINTVLTRSAQRTSRAPKVEPVSPYMLYRLARRYDDLSGEADVGSHCAPHSRAGFVTASRSIANGTSGRPRTRLTPARRGYRPR